MKMISTLRAPLSRQSKVGEVIAVAVAELDRDPLIDLTSFQEHFLVPSHPTSWVIKKFWAPFAGWTDQPAQENPETIDLALAVLEEAQPFGGLDPELAACWADFIVVVLPRLMPDGMELAFTHHKDRVFAGAGSLGPRDSRRQGLFRYLLPLVIPVAFIEVQSGDTNPITESMGSYADPPPLPGLPVTTDMKALMAFWHGPSSFASRFDPDTSAGRHFDLLQQKLLFPGVYKFSLAVRIGGSLMISIRHDSIPLSLKFFR